MIIATLNIDWAKTNPLKARVKEFAYLIDAEILVLTESVDLNLVNYDFVYRTTCI